MCLKVLHNYVYCKHHTGNAPAVCATCLLEHEHAIRTSARKFFCIDVVNSLKDLIDRTERKMKNEELCKERLANRRT